MQTALPVCGTDGKLSSVELGIYFYPKGEEPKYRQVLGEFHAIAGGPRGTTGHVVKTSAFDGM